MQEKSLEELLNDIKKIIKNLESDNIEIDNAIKLFEDGIEKINFANKKLNNIKDRVIKIVKDNKPTEFNNKISIEKNA